jgi:putative aminopeptidase
MDESTLFERLRSLAPLGGVSGAEMPVIRALRGAVTPLCDEVTVDAVGNLYAIRRGARPGPTVLIAAHSDEIGLVVKGIDPRGFLRFDKVGGVQDALLPARLVRVAGRLGVIGVRSGHYQTAEQRSRITPPSDLYVDVGAASAAEVADFGIRIGTPIAFVQDVVRLNGSLVAGQAIDDRLGCALLWGLLEGPPPPAGTLVVAFTSQEEIGLRGAAIATRRIEPDLAIAVDTMPSGDTPDMDPLRDLPVALGRGPALQVRAGRGSYVLHPGVERTLTTLAERHGIPLQRTTFLAGNNDADALAWAGKGTAAGSICLPRRYSHGPLEVADLRDALHALALLRALVAAMAEPPTWGFLEEATESDTMQR